MSKLVKKSKMICCETNDKITEQPISTRNYVAWGDNQVIIILKIQRYNKSLNLLELNKYLVGRTII